MPWRGRQVRSAREHRAAPGRAPRRAVWAGWSALVGYAAHRLPLRPSTTSGPFTRIRPWERDGRMWERLGIRRWKDRLPESGDLFRGGVSKRSLPGRHPDELARFAAETRRAEIVHWAIPLVYPCSSSGIRRGSSPPWPPMRWWPTPPCIVVQRYNRARLLRVLRRRERPLHPL